MVKFARLDDGNAINHDALRMRIAIVIHIVCIERTYYFMWENINLSEVFSELKRVL
jgi:hypothetical protein